MRTHLSKLLWSVIALLFLSSSSHAQSESAALAASGAIVIDVGNGMGTFVLSIPIDQWYANPETAFDIGADIPTVTPPPLPPDPEQCSNTPITVCQMTSPSLISTLKSITAQICCTCTGCQVQNHTCQC
jgi:hypothetical protein